MFVCLCLFALVLLLLVCLPFTVVAERFRPAPCFPLGFVCFVVCLLLSLFSFVGVAFDFLPGCEQICRPEFLVQSHGSTEGHLPVRWGTSAQRRHI